MKTQKLHHHIYILLAALFLSTVSLFGQTSGTFSSIQVGDANISGTLDAAGGTLFLGSWESNSAQPGISINYVDNDSAASSQLNWTATRATHAWLWERGSSTQGVYEPMMKLGENHMLTIYDAAGNAAIVFDPSSKRLTLTDSAGGSPLQLVLDPNQGIASYSGGSLVSQMVFSPNGTVAINGQNVLTVNSANQLYLQNGKIDLGGGMISNALKIIASSQLIVGNTALIAYRDPTSLVVTTSWPNDDTYIMDDDHLVAWFKTSEPSPSRPFELKMRMYASGSTVEFQTGKHQIYNGGNLTFQPHGGRVGIGLGWTKPLYTLDVGGNINFSGNFYQKGVLTNVGPKGGSVTVNGTSVLDVQGQAVLSGPTYISGPTHIEPQGDLDMGNFTTASAASTSASQQYEQYMSRQTEEQNSSSESEENTSETSIMSGTAGLNSW